MNIIKKFLIVVVSITFLLLMGCSGGSMSNTYTKSGPIQKDRSEGPYKKSEIKISKIAGCNEEIIIKDKKELKKRRLLIQRVNDEKYLITIKEE
jgi:hypothetical protein